MQRSLKPLADPAAPIVLDKIVFGGIGKRNINPPPGGALVQLSPSFLAPGDTAALYWQDPNTAVAEYVYSGSRSAAGTDDDREDLLPTLLVPGVHLALHPGDVDVWYVVRNAVSGSENESVHTTVRANFLVPGDPDPDHTTEYINENLVPVATDDIVDVTKDVVLAIPRWLNCEPGDRLVVSWGKDTLDAVTVVDYPATVSVTVPATVIAANPGDVVVTYFIIDEVGNHSLAAPAKIVHVGPKDNYPAPEVQGTDDNGSLPIDSLGAGPARVEVSYPSHAAGDVVVLTWGGVTREGVPIAETTYTFTWADTTKHTFEVPYDRVLPLVGGEIRTSYTVRPAAGTTTKQSDLAIVKVTGTVTALPPPKVKEAVGNLLDPAVLGVGATVQVATDYAFLSEGDRITMRWRGVSADGATVVTDQQTKFPSGAIGSIDAAIATSAQGRRAPDAINPLEFIVPKARIEMVAGGTATVSYDVLTPAGVVVTSGSLTLSITAVGDDAFRFDFDGSNPSPNPISSTVDGPERNPLRFDKVFDWRFDSNHLPTQTQYIGVKPLSGGVEQGVAEGDVLWIGHKPEDPDTLVNKTVFCDLYQTWTSIQFAVSAIDDDFSVSFQDAAHELIGPVQQFAGSPRSRTVTSIDAPASNKIKYIEIRCSDTIHLDFFVMKR